MLRKDANGIPFNKAERNRALQPLVGKSHGSIEYKHQNISAVLHKLGQRWLPGYRPAMNYSKSLVEVIEERLALHNFEISIPEPKLTGFGEPSAILIEKPPERQPSKEKPAERAMERVMRKFDPAAKDARNRKLGRLGEQMALFMERQILQNADRNDLARKVEWVSEEDGDGAGYDIRSYTPDGREKFVEVKTTSGHKATPFYLSENERSFSLEAGDRFRLMRLYDFYNEAKAFELRSPLTDFVSLDPTNYRASF